jgi:hypothetical protein
MAKEKEDPKKSAKEINDSFSALRETLKSIGEELGINVNKITEAKKEYRSLLDVAKQLQNNEEEISKLSDQQVKSLRSKAESSLRDLKATAEKLAKEKGINDITKVNLKNKKRLSDTERTLLSMLQEEFSVEEQILAQLQKEDKIRDDISKKTGVMGGLLEGLNKIPILGDVFKANDALGAAQNKIRETGSSAKGLGAAFGNIGKQITGGVLNPANVLLGVITLILDAVLGVDKAAGEYAKSMNVSYNEALQLRGELSKMAIDSGDMALNSKALQETLSAVGQSLGTNAKLNEADLKTFTKLREQAGFTNEELMGVQKLSLVNGKSLKDNTSAILGGAKAYASRNKLVVNEKQILKDISSASASLQLSLGGSADELARSAVQARQFGISLEQAEKMSQSLLDFESSIENELSAELVTGKDLNLERARGLALNGDSAAAAAEIAAQVGTSADFAKMNVIQQESIAKAIGMQREELAQSLIDRESLAKLGAKEGQSAQDRYNELKAQGMSQSEIAKKLGDEELAKQYEQQSVQEQFNQQIEHMKEIFVEMSPALLSIGQALMSMFGVVGMILKPVQAIFDFFGWIGKGISKLLGPLGAVGKVIKGIASIAIIYAAYQAYASLATIPVAGVALGLAASVGILAAGFGLLGSIKDGVINPKGGLVVSGEKGSIQLDPKDSIIAGTDLVPKGMNDGAIDSKGKVVASGAKGSIGGSDMSAVISAINALANRPINVSIDGKKVIEATTGANPNTQGDENRKNSYKMS